METPQDNRFSSKYLNLAEERLGSVVLATTDDFFGEKENIIKQSDLPGLLKEMTEGKK